MVLLLLTLFATYVIWKKNEEAAQAQFNIQRTELVGAIEQRLAAYTQSLRSGLALFKVSETVSREKWRQFVAALDLQSTFPGIQGLGYAEFVRPEDRERYEDAVRREGFPDFVIRPPGERKIYSSITFLEPFDLRNRQAFGYDMYSQETRRQAMDLARDSGEPAISGKVTLVQEITEDVQAGFLIYLPYYGQGANPTELSDRRRRIAGYIYSPFRMGDLIQGILGLGNPLVRLQIFDGTSTDADALMIDTDRSSIQPRKHSKFREIIPFRFTQHDWTLLIASEATFEAKYNSSEAQVVMVVGLVTSLLVFGVHWSFASTNKRARSLAIEMTKSLAERTQELTRSNQELEQFAYVASHDLRSPLHAIDNLASWLQEDLDESLSPESRRHLTALRGRIHRMHSMLEGLLQYARIGNEQHDVQSVDANLLVRDALDMAALPPGYSVTIKPGLPVFYTHRAPLLHVLQNLIANAAKHHDRETGLIEIRGRDLGSHVSFAVTDDGPGIPVEYHEKIFGMFQTLKRRDELETSGMGLALVKRYVELYGGIVGLDSDAKRRGAEFRFTWKKEPTPGP